MLNLMCFAFAVIIDYATEVSTDKNLPK